MTLIGYAGASVLDPQPELQLAALRAAGCQVIIEEAVDEPGRPQLERLLDNAKAGDILVFWKLDRLGHSLQQLWRTAARLGEKGVSLRCLGAPFDTSGPAGGLMLQMLGMFAEFERSLIIERSRAGLKRAAAAGRIGGNPALRRHDPEALRKNGVLRRRRYAEALNRTAALWLPIVRRLRPGQPWATVTLAINAVLPPDQRPWTTARLTAAVRHFVEEGLAEPELLDRAPAEPPERHLLTLVAAIKGTNPTITLQALGERLIALGETPPRGGRRWQASSLSRLVAQARNCGLLGESSS